MKIITEKKRITVAYERLVLDDGFVFSDVWELIDLLQELDTCDGYFERVVIYNSEWEKKLEELGVISTNNQGSAGTGKKFREFVREIELLTQRNIS
jgi:hypothetical protein